MARSTLFGIGITLMLIGMAVFYWVHSLDPGDNTPVAIVIGVVFVCPGAVMLGLAIWPPPARRQ